MSAKLSRNLISRSIITEASLLRITTEQNHWNYAARGNLPLNWGPIIEAKFLTSYHRIYCR